MYRIVGTSRTPNRCARCHRTLDRTVWLVRTNDGRDQGEPIPYGSECAAMLAGRTVAAIERAANLAPATVTRRRIADELGQFDFMLEAG